MIFAFGKLIFSKTSSYKVEIQEVGGCEELKKFITRLLEKFASISCL